jgi:hypothetical protein
MNLDQVAAEARVSGAIATRAYCLDGEFAVYHDGGFTFCTVNSRLNRDADVVVAAINARAARFDRCAALLVASRRR